ncbi:orotidine-5'-phosphate decarboxylase [Myxococcota bacterium]|nr:orotidine-5'-phosphate decarboxylase [Myxococcota bacterium]MBU1535393.1 orotidine-5'-phosphate decarboxylase [Myxococcota bacterium]
MNRDPGEIAARKRLILALDMPGAKEALELAETVKDVVGCFKVGLQLFLREGPSIVERVARLGVPVFLDLKLHDIPATVAKAVISLKGLPISFLTIHTAGGIEMMEAAADAASSLDSSLALLGVTLLTSLSESDFPQVGLMGSSQELVLRRAMLAREAGLAGVVASAREVSRLRQAVGEGFYLVIPGIRPAGAGNDDQKRIATPQSAIALGATHLVVGRPISASADPGQSARAILSMIEEAQREPI